MEIAGAVIGGVLAILAAILGGLVATRQIQFDGLLRWRRSIPGGFVIIVNGGSGVGKTTIAAALAERLNINQLIGTDVIREVLRYTIPTDAENPRALLLTSSFLAHYRIFVDHPEEKGDKVVDAFRLQSTELVGPIIRVINRVRSKRDRLIIEGINVLAGDVFTQIPNDVANSVFFVNLFLESEELHLARLRERGIHCREFPELTDRYIREIASIRKIDAFLKDDTNHAILASPTGRLSIVSLENSGSVNHTVTFIQKSIREKLKHLPGRKSKD